MIAVRSAVRCLSRFPRNTGAIALLCLNMAFLPACALASEEPKTLLEKVQKQEQRILTGCLKMESETYIPKARASDIIEWVRTISDPKLVKIRLTHEKNRKERTSKKSELWFDHNRQLVSETGQHSNGQEFRNHYSRNESQYLSSRSVSPEASAPFMVDISPSEWLTQYPLNVLIGRSWGLAQLKTELTPLRFVETERETGRNVFSKSRTISSKAESVEVEEKFWADPMRGNALMRYQLLRKSNGQLVRECHFAYKEYDGKIWFPETIITTSYKYDKEGKCRMQEQTIVRISEVRLNLTLTESNLDFGEIPNGSEVQDNRYDPPKNYRKGIDPVLP